MEKIKIIVTEDEKDILNWELECLSTFDEIDIVGFSDNTKDAYQLILKKQPHAVFADINLRDGNIITDVFLKLKLNNIKLPYLVFISGHPEYAAKLINEYSDFVVKFIEKPFVHEWEEKFQEAISSIRSRMNRDNHTFEVKTNQIDHLFVKSGENYIKLNYKDILWVEVAGNGGSYYVSDTDNYLVDLTLNKISEQLPKDQFMRISRDIMINLHHLKKVNKEDRTAIVIKQSKEKGLGIGDSYYSDLLKIIKG